jgi:hypothetical protein
LKLKTFKEVTKMPKKFVEKTESQMQPQSLTAAAMSPEPVNPEAQSIPLLDKMPEVVFNNQPLEQVVAAADQPSFQVRPVSSLAELLSSQSSSRNKLVL